MGRINNFPMTIEIADSLSRKFAMIGKGIDPNGREVEYSVNGKIRKRKLSDALMVEKKEVLDWTLRETNMITPFSESR